MSTRWSRPEMRWALALLLPAAAGCDEDPEDLVRQTIGPAGGLVSSHDDVLTLVFVPGALDREHEIVILPSDEPPLVFGPAYRVKPNDVELAVDVEVHYTRVLPANPDGVAVAAIRLDDYSAEMGHWVPLPRLAIDVDSGSVLAADSEISLYYGMVEYGSATDDAMEGEAVEPFGDVETNLRSDP